MSIRRRSTVGAALLIGGVLAAILSFAGDARPVLWTGLAAAGAGILLLAWGLRDVAREIGAARDRYDAMLRAEAEEKREQKPPGGR